MSPSTNGSKNSNGNGTESPKPPPGSLLEQENTTTNWDKVRQMEFIRLQDDNQTILDMVTASDKAHRQWQFKERQRLSETPDPQEIAFPQGEDDDMRTYRIDSDDRVTHNHYYGQPQNSSPPSPAQSDNSGGPAPAPTTISKLWPWITAGSLLLGGTGAGLATMALLRKAPAPVANSDTDTDTAIELVPVK